MGYQHTRARDAIGGAFMKIAGAFVCGSLLITIADAANASDLDKILRKAGELIPKIVNPPANGSSARSRDFTKEARKFHEFAKGALNSTRVQIGTKYNKPASSGPCNGNGALDLLGFAVKPRSYYGYLSTKLGFDWSDKDDAFTSDVFAVFQGNEEDCVAVITFPRQTVGWRLEHWLKGSDTKSADYDAYFIPRKQVLHQKKEDQRIPGRFGTDMKIESWTTLDEGSVSCSFVLLHKTSPIAILCEPSATNDVEWMNDDSQRPLLYKRHKEYDPVANEDVYTHTFTPNRKFRMERLTVSRLALVRPGTKASVKSIGPLFTHTQALGGFETRLGSESFEWKVDSRGVSNAEWPGASIVTPADLERRGM